jgi:probable phosphoglycerate mutase
VTELVLIRHGAHDLLGTLLAGRTVDVPLNAQGRAQAKMLAAELRDSKAIRIMSSPRRRALETATPIAAALARPLEIASALDEHDAGSFAGRRFEALRRNPRWRDWNSRRASARPPAGESMAELQTRVVGFLARLVQRHPDDRLVLVSHAEPIRAALMYVQHVPLDDFLKVDVPVASVHRLRLQLSETSVGMPFVRGAA